MTEKPQPCLHKPKFWQCRKNRVLGSPLRVSVDRGLYSNVAICFGWNCTGAVSDTGVLSEPATAKPHCSNWMIPLTQFAPAKSQKSLSQFLFSRCSTLSFTVPKPTASLGQCVTIGHVGATISSLCSVI